LTWIDTTALRRGDRHSALDHLRDQRFFIVVLDSQKNASGIPSACSSRGQFSMTLAEIDRDLLVDAEHLWPGRRPGYWTSGRAESV